MCIYVLVYTVHKNKLDEPGWQFLWLRPAEIRTNFWAKTIFKNVDLKTNISGTLNMQAAYV